jgi:hypothetical protein
MSLALITYHVAPFGPFIVFEQYLFATVNLSVYIISVIESEPKETKLLVGATAIMFRLRLLSDREIPCLKLSLPTTRA